MLISTASPGPILSRVLFVALCLVWGSTWLAIKVGLRDLPPLTGAALRFWVAGLVMAGLAWLLSEREGGSSPPRSLVITQGVCQFVLNYALVYLSETVIPSGLVSVLWSIFPLMMALAGHFVTKAEPLRPGQWLGFSLGFFGIVALFINDVASISSRAVGMGLLLLLAPAAVAFSTTLIKVRGAGVSSLLLNRDSILFGALGLTLLSFLFERDARVEWSFTAIASILYLALPGTVFTFGVYLWLMRYLPAYWLSLTAYLTPLVALLLGATLGNEVLYPSTVIGTVLVLGGVALTFRARAARTVSVSR